MLNSSSDVETYEDSFKSSIFIYATAETMMVIYVHSWYTAIRNEFNEWLYYFILMTRYIYTKCWLAYECSEHMFPVSISANKTGHTWTTITFLNYPWNCWTVSLFLLQRMSICLLHLVDGNTGDMDYFGFAEFSVSYNFIVDVSLQW